MSRALALAAAALGLAACTALEPYPTYAPPPEGHAAAGPRVAMCYDGLVSSRAQVRRAAQAQCPAGTVATPAGTDWTMQNCPLLLPARAVFACVATK